MWKRVFGAITALALIGGAAQAQAQSQSQGNNGAPGAAEPAISYQVLQAQGYNLFDPAQIRTKLENAGFEVQSDQGSPDGRARVIATTAFQAPSSGPCPSSRQASARLSRWIWSQETWNPFSWGSRSERGGVIAGSSGERDLQAECGDERPERAVDPGLAPDVGGPRPGQREQPRGQEIPAGFVDEDTEGAAQCRDVLVAPFGDLVAGELLVGGQQRNGDALDKLTRLPVLLAVADEVVLELDLAALAAPARDAINIDIPPALLTKDVVGAPKLTMTYSGLGTSRHVYAQLVDNNTDLVLGNIITPIPVILDGQTHTTDPIDLESIAYTMTPSVSLTLQIVGATSVYADATQWGFINVTDALLSLPTVA